MSNSTLFPLEHEPMKPDTSRREPRLWLKRLVILSELNSTAEIRNIEFRRGLNIIQTHQMQVQGGPVAGHSVGKTLLMRLIRYTLGELNFGTEDTQVRIGAVLKSAYVVAHWCVAGADWIVVRPLWEADVQGSFAVCDGNWQQVVDSQQHKQPHRDFVQAVGTAVLSQLPVFNLPRGREAKWLDVLAWLSRDYQSGYRKANEWRHEDAESGPTLDREDNSLVMQWVMGLMSPEEIELRLKHHELLKKKAEKKRAAERDQQKLETLWPALKEKLEIEESAEVVDEQSTFDSIQPENVVTNRIALLGRLRQERIAESRVADFKAEYDAAQRALVDTEAEIRFCRKAIEFNEKQIAAYENDPGRAYRRCKALPSCWMRDQAAKVAYDAAKDDHLADFRAIIDEQRHVMSQAQDRVDPQQTALQDAARRLAAEEKRLSDELAGIDEVIGRWKASLHDAKVFQGTVRSVSRAEKAQKSVDGKVDASLKNQEDVRRKHRRQVAGLSQVYQETLQRIFGKEARGGIQIDGNGLHPAPDRKLAPAGAALSVMTTVLAFDIACVAASIAGIGAHPRFLMHDSPREGDMEAPLFRRLFEVVYELEGEFEKHDLVSFQYIVTTTTAPPKILANPKGPYVRETLDAQNVDDLLLKKKF